MGVPISSDRMSRNPAARLFAIPDTGLLAARRDVSRRGIGHAKPDLQRDVSSDLGDPEPTTRLTRHPTER